MAAPTRLCLVRRTLQRVYDGIPIHPRNHTSRLTIPLDSQLQKLESPDYDVKDESESPTNIQYLKRYSQVAKTSNSSPTATTQIWEHPNFNTGGITDMLTGNDYQLPEYSTGYRPFSYPIGSTPGISASSQQSISNPISATVLLCWDRQPLLSHAVCPTNSHYRW